MIRLVLGVIVLLLGYVLPFFHPPEASPLVAVPDSSPLLVHLFPNTPRTWVMWRLASLAVGCVLLVGALPNDSPETRESKAIHGSKRVAPPIGPVACLLISVGLFLLSFRVDLLSRYGQLFYLGALFLPAFVAGVMDRSGAGTESKSSGTTRRWTAITAVLVLCWVAIVAGTAIGSSYAANAVDTWQNVHGFARAIQEDRNLLLSADQPTMNDLHMLLVGADLFHRHRPPTLSELQFAGILWCALGACFTAAAVSITRGPRYSPFAAATMLFAPMTIGLCHFPYPFVLGIAGPSALAYLVSSLWRDPRPHSLLALAAVAGLNATQGYVATWSGPAVCAAIAIGLRQRAFPILLWLAAALVLGASVVPSLSGVDPTGFLTEVADGHWPWWAVEAFLFDQRAGLDIQGFAELRQSGRVVPIEIAISGLLAPFLHPRTSLRLWGDLLLEPISAALFLVGIGMCLWRQRDRFHGPWLIGATLFVHLPVVLTTSYDRPSALRNLALPVAAALIGAVTIDAAARVISSRQRDALALTIALLVSISGLLLFYRATLASIAEPAIGLFLRGVDSKNPHGADFLYIPTVVHPRSSEIDEYFPRDSNKRILAYTTKQSLVVPSDPASPSAKSIWWSPGTEDECAVSEAVCSRWPDAGIWLVTSGNGLSRAFAAVPERAEALRLRAGTDLAVTRFDCSTFPPRTIGPRRYRWCTPEDSLPSAGGDANQDVP